MRFLRTVSLIDLISLQNSNLGQESFCSRIWGSNPCWGGSNFLTFFFLFYLFNFWNEFPTTIWILREIRLIELQILKKSRLFPWIAFFSLQMASWCPNFPHQRLGIKYNGGPNHVWLIPGEGSTELCHDNSVTLREDYHLPWGVLLFRTS